MSDSETVEGFNMVWTGDLACIHFLHLALLMRNFRGIPTGPHKRNLLNQWVVARHGLERLGKRKAKDKFQVALELILPLKSKPSFQSVLFVKEFGASKDPQTNSRVHQSGKMKSICTLLKWLFIGRAHSTFIKFENSKSLIKSIRVGQGILSIDRNHSYIKLMVAVQNAMKWDLGQCSTEHGRNYLQRR